MRIEEFNSSYFTSIQGLVLSTIKSVRHLSFPYLNTPTLLSYKCRLPTQPHQPHEPGVWQVVVQCDEHAVYEHNALVPPFRVPHC